MRAHLFLRAVPLLAVLRLATVQAACMPWGPPPGSPGDDNGCLTLDAAKSKCEQTIAGNVSSKLVGPILKCHMKLAADLFRRGMASTFDEEACESAAMQKFADKSDNSGCPCVNEPIVELMASVTLDDNNYLVSCDPDGPAINTFPNGGDDTGRVPSTPAVLACETAMGKAIAKLVKSRIKCHQKYAADYVKTNGYPVVDEETCEDAADAVFATAVARLPGCQGCEDVPGVFAQMNLTLDGANSLVFCEE
ncbi:MAG: hypothetical protein U0807_16250 [Candidatus Binatia bacterium]